MKLLICTSEYFPHGSGIANVVYNVVGHLKEQHIECTICSPTGPDIRVGSKKLIDKFGFPGLVYYWYKVSRVLKEDDYDAVWLHNPYFIISNPFSVGLVTMHSTYYGMNLRRVGDTRFLRLFYQVISKIEEFCLTRMSKKTVFTGVGQPVCDELEMMGIEKDRIHYVLNGADIRQYRPVTDKKTPRKKFGIPEDSVAILSIGRLTPQKRPQVMIDVFSVLTGKMENLKLCIAGKGELLDFTKKYVMENEIPNVIFLGYADDSALPDLYACSDYYIITSIYEGGMPPLTLSEAMASGLPCIVSDIPNFMIVHDADCGIVVNFEDPGRAANEILDYIGKDTSRHAINARTYAIQFLDWKNITHDYLRIFQSICDSKSTSEMNMKK